MSYDLNIKLGKKAIEYLAVKDFVNSLPNTKNQRMEIGNRFYLEIDLEFIDDKEEYIDAAAQGKVNCISFHIPYDFMNKMLNPDLYYDYVRRVSEFVEERAYDLQLDLFMDDPNFKLQKRWHKTYNKDTLYNTFDLSNKQLSFSNNLVEYQPLEIDLSLFKINLKKDAIVPQAQYDDFQIFKFYISPDNKYVILTNWKEKVLKIFQHNNVDYSDQVTLKQMWSDNPIREISKCGQVRSLQFSEDGKFLFTNSYKNKTLKLWDIETGLLIENFSSYANYVSFYRQITNELICICSASGIGFFDIKTGKNVLQIVALKDNWIAFTPEGDYDWGKETNAAIQLDFIDNDKSESFCFLPGVGFGYIEGYPPFRKNKFNISKGVHKENILEIILKPYFE